VSLQPRTGEELPIRADDPHIGQAGQLGALLGDAGFVDVRFVTACEVGKEDRRYPIFLVTATKPR